MGDSTARMSILIYGERWVRESAYQELQRRLFSVEDAVIEPYCDELEARAEQAEQTRDKLAEAIQHHREELSGPWSTTGDAIDAARLRRYEADMKLYDVLSAKEKTHEKR